MICGIKCIRFLVWVPFLAACLCRAEDAPDGRTFKGELIYLRDYGTDDIAYLVVPQDEPKAGIVIVPDGYGIDDEIKRRADAFSERGFLVLVADLYNGSTTRNAQQAAKMVADLMPKTVLSSLKTTVNFFQNSPRFKMDKVVIISVGNTAPHVLDFASKKDSGLAAAVFFQPSAAPSADQIKQLRCPAEFCLDVQARATEGWRALSGEDKTDAVEIKELSSTSERKDGSSEEWNAAEAFIRSSLTQEKKNLFQKIFD